MTIGTGERVSDRYRLESRIAVGGMGEVWRARDDMLGRDVAVKILRTEYAADHAFRARFRAEARTAGSLSHGGIAAVYDYGEAPGLAYLVMELVPGEPLSATILREGPLGSRRTLDVVAQAARALHAAHQRGVVHRDVKPANLMITPDGVVKVTDFGIARPLDHEPLTATGQVMGTAHYLAPELARGDVASPLSDVYALGVVMYECLAGRRPFDGSDQIAVATAHLTQAPPPLPETLPADVRRLVAAAMAKDPADRPPGGDALAAAAEWLRVRSTAPATRDEPPARNPPGPPERTVQTTTSTRRSGRTTPPTAPLPLTAARVPWWRNPVVWASVVAIGALVLAAVVGAALTAGSPTESSANVAARPTPNPGEPVASTTPAGDPATPRTTGSTPSAEPVLIDKAAYLGRRLGPVRRELRGLGVVVAVQPAPSDLPRRTVVHVEPTGPVVPGSTVTVVVSAGESGEG
jgi:serine/threonine-protein kinase